MDSNIRCPKCGNLVDKYEINRYSGICKRCYYENSTKRQNTNQKDEFCGKCGKTTSKYELHRYDGFCRECYYITQNKKQANSLSIDKRKISNYIEKRNKCSVCHLLVNEPLINGMCSSCSSKNLRPISIPSPSEYVYVPFKLKYHGEIHREAWLDILSNTKYIYGEIVNSSNSYSLYGFARACSDFLSLIDFYNQNSDEYAANSENKELDELKELSSKFGKNFQFYFDRIIDHYVDSFNSIKSYETLSQNDLYRLISCLEKVDEEFQYFEFSSGLMKKLPAPITSRITTNRVILEDNISAIKGKNKRQTTSSVESMAGDEFESFCADILRKKGYSDVRITPSSGDQGVDITCSKDFIKYAIQCKRYNAPLGNTPIQEVFAGKMFYGCDVAIVMTNSTFTDAAIALAKATGVILWDGSVLNRMIKDIS